MKLVRTEVESEVKGDFDELATTLALWHAEDTELYEELFSQIARDEWRADIPPELGIEIVEGMGLRLFNDDDTPASRDTVVQLGQRTWERLQEIVEMEVADEI